MVKKLEQSLEKCVCPEGQKECECPKVEIIELIPYNGALGYNSNASKVNFTFISTDVRIWKTILI